MIEIVFSESACGSLTVGQGYGTGRYIGGATSVLLRKEDGSSPTAEELRAAQKSAEEKLRREWENAVPLGSSRRDVYCFELALSIGQLSEEEIGGQRRAALEKVFAAWPGEDINRLLEEKLDMARKSLAQVLERSGAGEPVRIWYSHNPDEMCGMYWLLSKLRHLKQRGPVYLVRLPEWEYRDEKNICTHTGWGEIAPGAWGHYQSLQQEAKPVLLSSCAAAWDRLRAENAPLRVFLNGNLRSAPEDIYDSFILREIDRQPEVFMEALVIGAVMGKYQLGIGDAWIALRIEKMIGEGKLEVAEPASEDDCRYRQKLRKRVCAGQS